MLDFKSPIVSHFLVHFQCLIACFVGKCHDCESHEKSFYFCLHEWRLRSLRIGEKNGLIKLNMRFLLKLSKNLFRQDVIWFNWIQHNILIEMKYIERLFKVCGCYNIGRNCYWDWHKHTARNCIDKASWRKYSAIIFK